MKIKKSMLEAKAAKFLQFCPGLFHSWVEPLNFRWYSNLHSIDSPWKVPLNDVIQVMNDDGVVSIIGDPGFGKTIQLRQFTYKLIANQLEDNSTNIIPIYVKAKSLSKNIQEKATSPIGFVIGDSKFKWISWQFYLFKARSSLIFSSRACLKQNLNWMENCSKDVLHAAKCVRQHVSHHRRIWRDSLRRATNGTHFIHWRQPWSSQMPVVMTCRKSQIRINQLLQRNKWS